MTKRSKAVRASLPAKIETWTLLEPLKRKRFGDTNGKTSSFSALFNLETSTVGSEAAKLLLFVGTAIGTCRGPTHCSTLWLLDLWGKCLRKTTHFSLNLSITKCWRNIWLEARTTPAITTALALNNAERTFFLTSFWILNKSTHVFFHGF